MGDAVAIRSDASALPLANASVNLIVTSPPYWSQRSYIDEGVCYDGQIGNEPTMGEYIDSLIRCTQEWMRILKPEGSIFVNLGDKYNSPASGQNLKDIAGTNRRGTKRYDSGRGRVSSAFPTKSLLGAPWRYAIRCVDDLGLTLRSEVIWFKSNSKPDPTRDRVARTHETWFHLVKRARYFSSIDEVREPAPRGMDPRGKIPGSVWNVATESLVIPKHLGSDHYAAFPVSIIARIIRGWCPLNGVVLDPFGGTGTAALVARVLGRTGISVDRSADYCRIASWRINDPDQIAKAGLRGQ